MKFKELKEKVKEYDYGKLFSSKAFLISGCVVMIVAAIIVNALLPTPANVTETPDESESGKILGNSVLVDTNGEAEGENAQATEETDNYFTVATVNREKSRNEAMDVLQTIADNPEALADAKEQALLDISKLVSEMNAETNIESLVNAKGFEQCVAIVSDKQASVIVKSDELKAGEVAQILEIVYLETGILPENTKVIQK